MENNCASDIESISPYPGHDLLLSAVNFSDDDHFLLPVTLSFGQKQVELVAMLDSGATGNFINTSMVHRH
jgi:hypothetical protein